MTEKKEAVKKQASPRTPAKKRQGKTSVSTKKVVRRKKTVGEIKHPPQKKREGVRLERSEHNPILSPIGEHAWESSQTFNPAAVLIDGKVHLIYRSIGEDGISRFGYAASYDGERVHERHPHPIFSLLLNTKGPQPYHAYPSGGSWGGAEDPRIVAIEGRVYVTFNMFDDWKLCVGVVSMSEDDFLEKHFDNWDDLIIISNSDREKNWMLFPEKIGGQFAVLHSIIGGDKDHVRIEFVDDLADLAKRKFSSPDPQKMPDDPIAWHIRMRSAGPPPIKTDRGWLVLYHAMDPKESNHYKLGAMLLDLNDPTRVIARAKEPILEPEAWYENYGWKGGIVYGCGAVVLGDDLFVYYGGADSVGCVARTKLDTFLNDIMKERTPKLRSARMLRKQGSPEKDK